MTAEKHHVRTHARIARLGIAAEARLAASEAAAARALALPHIAGARGVLAYAATTEEIDPAPVVARLRAVGARIAYPRVCGPGEIALHWAEDEELTPGYCGILEPADDAPVADPADIDLVLVPGVAFDEECHRLGMGGGFYDRLLPRLHAGAVSVGLAFDEQIVERVPREEHDVRLDAVVTPGRTVQPAQ